ncbi:MAG TPA: hypothetical protein PLR26_02795 [Bacilli bacterium]|nr:hypothetical protein [Bacilli bacterium]
MKKSIQTVVILSILLILGGCAFTQEEQDFFNEYGKGKAFMQTSAGEMISPATPNNIQYYIEPDTLQKYHQVFSHAIDKFNAINGINVTITSNSSSLFRVNNSSGGTGGGTCGNPFTCNPDLIYLRNHNESLVAANLITIHSSNPTIIHSSTITFYAQQTNNLNDNELKYIALHELGHTFGLIDREHARFRNISIMYYITDLSTTFTDELYTFDKANLEWRYGQ